MRTILVTDDRLGGLHHIHCIPVSVMGEIEIDYATGLHSFTLNSTDGVYDIPCLGGDDYSFGEEHGRDENGDYWQPTVVGIIPHPDLLNAGDIEALERGEWIVLCEDQNGVLRLCGDEDTQLTFSTATTSGTAPTDKNQVVFTLTGKLGHPSYVVEGGID